MLFDKFYKEINLKLNKSIDEIRNFCEKVDMLDFLTYSAFLSRICTNNEGYKYLSPLHFEYLMGIFLSIGYDTSKKGKGTIEENGKIIENLKLMIGSWKISNSLRKIQGKSTMEEVDKGLFEASLISSGSTMRGYSWYITTYNQYCDIFIKYDKYLKDKIGFGIGEVKKYVHNIDFFYWQVMQNIRNNIEKDLDEDSGNNLESNDSGEFGIKLFCAMHSFNYKNCLFFDETDIQRIDTSVDIKSLKCFLDFFSVDIEVDRNVDFKYLNDSNLFSYHPIIKYNNKYFVINTNPIYWCMKERFEEIIKLNTNQWNKFNKLKSDYLEEKALLLIKKVFPDAQVYQSLYYIAMDGKRCELDGLVIYDNCILLIEAKSGIYSKSAQKGGVERLKNVIEANIQNAALQAKRAKEYILNSDKPRFEDEHKKEVLRIEKNGYENIYLINVTMDYFSELSVNLKLLQKMRLMDIEYFPWSVSLSDLEVITDFIQFPHQFLHYIYFREKLSNKVLIGNNYKHVFELDLFGFYLFEESDSLNNYFIDDTNENTFVTNMLFDKSEDDHCQIMDFSSIFNHYYQNKENGIYIDPPKKKYNTDYYSIIRQLEEYIKDGKGYANIAIKLLDLNNDKQDTLISYIYQLIDKSKKDGKEHSISVPHMSGNFDNTATFGMTIISGYSRERKELYDELQALCTLNVYKYKYSEWLGLCTIVDDNRHLVNSFVLVRQEIKNDPKINKILKQITFKNVGRNNPCPCGRGKKFKNCCGKDI